MGQGSRKSDADKEKPVRKEGKSRIKDKVSDFGAAIYDPKFFWHHGGERKGVATVVLHPSYSGLCYNTLNIQPGGDIAKGRVVSKIWDMPNGL